MITALWVAVLLAVECLVVLFFIPRGVASTVIAALFFICFAVVCWIVGAMTKEATR